MSASLTTSARFKAYAGITGTDQDALIASLIPQMSEQVIAHLKRDVAVATYKSWVNGSGSPILRLAQWPILAIYQVSLSTMAVGYIQNSSAFIKRASVSFDGTNLSLMSVDNTGTETLTDLPVATSKTLSALKTAIEAVSGWEVTLNSTDYATEPSSMLRPIFSAPAADGDTADLVLPDSQEAVKLIAEDLIELIHPISFSSAESIIQGFANVPGIGEGFPTGSANVFVWYKAGYTLPSDASGETPASDGTLPPGLALIVHQIMQDVLSSTKLNSNLQSESIGGYSYSLRSDSQGAVASAVRNRARDLDAYMKVTL